MLLQAIELEQKPGNDVTYLGIAIGLNLKVCQNWMVVSLPLDHIQDVGSGTILSQPHELRISILVTPMETITTRDGLPNCQRVPNVFDGENP